MYAVSDELFDDMVNQALDKIPDPFAELMGNVAILVRDFHEDIPTLLGLYEGVPLPERTHHHTGFLPDAIFIYKNALEAIATSEQHLAHEVEVTLFHEVGHYFGIEEHRLHELGWG